MGPKRDKKNNLEDDIRYAEKTSLNTLMGGGYYILTNIRKDPKTKECMDIYFITNRIEEKDLLHKITHIDEECRNYMMLNWDE